MTMDIFLGEEIDSNDGDSLANETPGIKVLPDICNLSYLQPRGDNGNFVAQFRLCIFSTLPAWWKGSLSLCSWIRHGITS